jgi:type II secretory pathway component PulM
MTALWTERAPREKLLLVIAASLLAMALVVQAVLVPSLNARSRAETSVTESTNTLTRLERLQATGAAFVPIAPVSQAPDAESEATRIATETGLVLNPTAGTALPLHFSFEPTEPTRIFSWIDQVESTLGLEVQTAEIKSAGPDLVNATIGFAGPPQP